MTVTLYNLDCRDAMGLFMAENSVDSVVTDPPYGLGFMGKGWDRGVPGVDFWRHAYAALKPGGYLLAFGGSRTYHRLVCAIEDAGFEIRDTIMWVYGSGFPKSHNLDGDWEGWGTALKPAHEPICVARKPFRSTVAINVLLHGTGALNIDGCRVITDDTLRIGSGGIPCRHDDSVVRGRAGEPSIDRTYIENGGTNFAMKPGPRGGDPLGRWPANLIHDGSDEVRATFPDAKGQQGDLVNHGTTRQSPNGIFGGMRPALDHPARIETDASAARFFYCAKASKKDRGEGNTHPTVKPTDLMRYLVRLVTPPGGVTADPFMGSGSTGVAAVLEGFSFIGCEDDTETDSFAVATRRIHAAVPSTGAGA